MIKKLKAAIKSRREFKNEVTEEQIRRLKICSECPFNSANKDKKTVRDKLGILLNKLLNFIFGIKTEESDICTICSCQLIHKTTQEDEELKCPEKLW